MAFDSSICQRVVKFPGSGFAGKVIELSHCGELT
jgi:hypothetical protein